MGKLGQWLQVGANIGILAGLVLVGVQMEQNSNLVKLQLIRQEADSLIAAEQAYVGEEFAEVWAKQFNDPQSLSLAEMRILESNLWSQSLYRWWKNYELYSMGLISEDDWKTPIVSDANFVLNSPYARAWWNVNKTPPSHFPQEFLDFVDSHLSDTERYGAREFYDRVKKEMERLQSAQRKRSEMPPN